jgi:hypothetical protein
MAKSKTDSQVIARLKREAPETLDRDVDFDALISRIIGGDSIGFIPSSQQTEQGNSNETSRSTKRKRPHRKRR